MVAHFPHTANGGTKNGRGKHPNGHSDGKKLVYTSPIMQQVVDRVDKIAATELPVLITGESGTGKELIARRIHERSTRKEGPFVGINCAGFSTDLIESELFGHEKGAFTGAITQKQGLFEQANGGTLFLDEIGDMPLGLQPKLLRALQEGVIHRVGGTHDIPVDVRVISATNRNVAKELKAGTLREDLYYRLNTAEVSLPPLRDRKEDIPALIDYLIHDVVNHEMAKRRKRAGGDGGLLPVEELHPPTVSPEALQMLQAHSWPGNVRELYNAIAAAVYLAQETGTITPDLLRLNSRISSQPPVVQTTAEVPATVAAEVRPIPIDSSFGFTLYSHRENRGWTQAQLAEHSRKHSNQPVTAAQVEAWETNKEVPDQTMVNTLAYILIIDTDRKAKQKINFLKAFFEAAENSREPELAKSRLRFSDTLKELREKQGLTPETLAEKINSTNVASTLDREAIHFMETGERESSPLETLNLVKALDTEQQPLTHVERFALHDSAKHSSRHQGSLDMATKLRPLKDQLRQIFIDAYKPEKFSHNKLVADSTVPRGAISHLMGMDNDANPRDRQLLGDKIRDNLAKVLEKRGVDRAKIAEFHTIFEEMREITGWNASMARKHRLKSRDALIADGTPSDGAVPTR